MSKQTGDILPLPGSAGAVGGTVGLAGMAASQAYYFIGPHVLRMLMSDIS